MLYNDILIASALAAGAMLLSLALFPFSLSLSRAIGAIDVPHGRKIHLHPTARAGGVAFFASFSLLAPLLSISFSLKASLLLGGGIIFITGILDDALELSPLQKLTGEGAAAAVPLLFGSAEAGSSSPRALVMNALALFWVLFLTNAINLSDGLDALAAGSSSVFALVLSLLFLLSARFDLFLCSLILLFALIGFLPHNAPPASIFMGDCGSLFIGYVLSLLSLEWLSASPSPARALSIVLLFGVPLFDTLQSFFRRLAHRKNPFSADRGHLHHKLLDRGFTKETASLALICCSLALGFIAFIIALI